jgi:hypothetical protein
VWRRDEVVLWRDVFACEAVKPCRIWYVWQQRQVRVEPRDVCVVRREASIAMRGATSRKSDMREGRSQVEQASTVGVV